MMVRTSFIPYSNASICEFFLSSHYLPKHNLIIFYRNGPKDLQNRQSLNCYVYITGLSCSLIISYKMCQLISLKEMHCSFICSAGDASKNNSFELCEASSVSSLLIVQCVCMIISHVCLMLSRVFPGGDVPGNRFPWCGGIDQFNALYRVYGLL